MRRRGVAAVETALLLSMLLLVVLGACEYAIQFHVLHRMTNAARDAARCLAVKNGTVSDAQTLALGELSDLQATFTVTATLPPDGTANPEVTVKITVPREQLSLNCLGFNTSGTIEANATMRKEGQ